MALLEFVRLLNASKKLSIKDDFNFISFDDITKEDIISDDQIFPETLEIWAAIKINYEGELPESYKTLNLLIGDWVEKNIKKLTIEMHSQLQEHFTEFYPNADTEELKQLEDTAIWMDQLDYMPIIKEEEKSIVIEIELVLYTESFED